MNRLLPLNRWAWKDMVRRLDRIAGDLNVLLVVFAIGLATLYMTFFFTQKMVDHLPPVTRVVYVESASH